MEERLTTELDLLEAIYPDLVKYNSRTRELTYSITTRKLELRISDGYLNDALPEVLSANVGRNDLRGQVKDFVSKCPPGEEVLDSIIASFDELAENATTNDEQRTPEPKQIQDPGAKATVVVWLHHLLNTNKRKQALSPSSASVSGMTKPGYPGVLVYSGSAEAVYEHVNELKQLNWQAFQVRFESDEEWSFLHGSGVMEVEAMKDLVSEVGETRKKAFLEAMRMK